MKSAQTKQHLNEEKLSGKIPFGFTNDYMFRAVLQKNEKVLKGILSAVLRIPPEEITSCQITNPIILGEAINEKTCILDVRLLLNNEKQVNLEMQILSYKSAISATGRNAPYIIPVTCTWIYIAGKIT